MCLQSIQTIRDISRDDRARIATCSLLTASSAYSESYSIDVEQTPPLERVNTFRYVGSKLAESGDVDAEMTHGRQSGWKHERVYIEGTT